MTGKGQVSRAEPTPGASRFKGASILELRVESLAAQIGLAFAIIAAVTLVGWCLRQLAPGAVPSALLFPAILFASLIGGWRSGATAGGLALLVRAAPFRPPIGVPTSTGDGYQLALFLLSAAAIIAIGVYARSLYDRLQRSRDVLAKQSLHYLTMFETMSEGFAVCDAIRDESGRLVDYTVSEINPALQRMLGVGPEAVGARLTDTPGNWTNWLSICDRVFTSGEVISFERFNRTNKRWHEVHLSRLTSSRMAQFFFDITDRKAGEAKQAELFNELNHRVKNNLAMVASLLQLQARGAGEAVREQLVKAAARVQGIAEVHDALSRGASRDDVDFGAYLQDLCASLRRTLVTEDRIHLSAETESVLMDVDLAIPLGMVVNELVTNSVKYAYPPGHTGTIDVGFRRDGEHVQLTVRDLGPGLPREADGAGGGLGMRLVRTLIEQVGGQLIIHDGEGADFEIRLAAANLV